MSSTDLPEEQPPLQPTEDTSGAEQETKGVSRDTPETAEDDAFKTLKYSLLGPSLLKAGQDKVDQTKVHILAARATNYH
jgi:DNA polymerase kappa